MGAEESRLKFFDDFLDLAVALLKVVIDEDGIPHGIISELHFFAGGFEANGDGCFVLGASVAQTFFELRHAGRRDKDEMRVEIDSSYRLASLHIQIEKAEFASVRHGLNCCKSRSVLVCVHLRRLYELIFCLKLREAFMSHKMIRNAVYLASTRSSGRVRY